ncbi:MAG: hypothetical protein KQA31_00785, partial [Candidatus Aenigmarchaeota archaeon]|nr:hypothetical protein [Candidatus Aenigmarchaeota archaeon]
VIGQEIEQIIPELVTHWGEENYTAVDYSRLTAVLIEAIKEQQNIIENQQKQIDQLKQENLRLNEDLNIIKSKLILIESKLPQ